MPLQCRVWYSLSQWVLCSCLYSCVATVQEACILPPTMTESLLPCHRRCPPALHWAGSRWMPSPSSRRSLPGPPSGSTCIRTTFKARCAGVGFMPCTCSLYANKVSELDSTSAGVEALLLQAQSACRFACSVRCRLLLLCAPAGGEHNI